LTTVFPLHTTLRDSVCRIRLLNSGPRKRKVYRNLRHYVNMKFILLQVYVVTTRRMFGVVETW